MNNSVISDNFLRSASATGVELNTPVLCAPVRVAQRLLYGENLLQMWIDHEHVSDNELIKLWQISKAELHAMAHDPYEAYRQLTGQQVLAFAKRIGVHPAHLSPASADPVYSMPFSVFMANYMMSNDSSETFENIALSKEAIKNETKRYHYFMAGKYTLKDMSSSNIAPKLKEAIANGTRDKILRQLDVHCTDPQKYNLLAPLMMDALLENNYSAYSHLTAREIWLSEELEKAKNSLHVHYKVLFGPVANNKDADITSYALDHLWGSMRAREGKNIVDAVARKITADVSRHIPVNSFGGEMPHRLSDVFKGEIENLARASTLYMTVQCKYDKFYAQNDKAMSEVSDNIVPLEYGRKWMMSDVGTYIRRLFANQAVLNPAPSARKILGLPVQRDSFEPQQISAP